MDDLLNIFNTMMPLVEKKSGVSPSIMGLWFAELTLMELTDSVAVFGTPTPIRQHILCTKYLDYIKEALEEVIGFSVEVEINVEPTLYKFPENKNGVVIVPYEEEKPDPELLAESYLNIKFPEAEVNAEEVEREIISGATTDKKSLLDEYTFENFVEGDSNKLARAACYAVAREPTSYNPLFIYGHSGLGKTHLLYAIINYIKQHSPELKIIYKKCETFLDELVRALNDGDTASFKERYRTADVLLIDDIQFLAGKEQTQEEFFHTFSALYEADKQIILASDRPPREIKPLEDRLRTRFEWGLLADVQPPSFELRVAIIRKKAAYMGLPISPDMVNYMAERLYSNVRQIEGVLKRLFAVYNLTGGEVTKERIEEVISIVDPGNIPTDTLVERILSAVSKYYGVSADDMKSKRKTEDISNARQVAMHIIKTVTHLTLKEIGAIFDRDYSTVIFSLKKVEEYMKTVNNYENTVNKIIKEVKG